VTRCQFEEYIGTKRFVEHGEYDKQYYGTSLDAVRTVINSGKVIKKIILIFWKIWKIWTFLRIFGNFWKF
jgi:guanylate kinase